MKGWRSKAEAWLPKPLGSDTTFQETIKVVNKVRSNSQLEFRRASEDKTSIWSLGLQYKMRCDQREARQEPVKEMDTDHRALVFPVPQARVMQGLGDRETTAKGSLLSAPEPGQVTQFSEVSGDL